MARPLSWLDKEALIDLVLRLAARVAELEARLRAAAEDTGQLEHAALAGKGVRPPIRRRAGIKAGAHRILGRIAPCTLIRRVGATFWLISADIAGATCRVSHGPPFHAYEDIRDSGDQAGRHARDTAPRAVPVLLSRAPFGKCGWSCPSVSSCFRFFGSTAPQAFFRPDRSFPTPTRTGRVKAGSSFAAPEGLALTRPSTLARCHELGLRYPLIVPLKGTRHRSQARASLRDRQPKALP